MKRTRTFIITIVIAIAFSLTLSGCNFNFQTVTPESAQKLAADVNALTAMLDIYQQSVDQMTAALAASGAIDPNAVTKLKATQAKIDTIQAQIQQASQAVANQPLTGDDIQNWITLLQAANAASASVNPYALPISAVLTAISLIFGFLKKKDADKNKADAAQKTAALTEVIKGGELFKANADEPAVIAFKAAQNDKQSTVTKQLVGTIRATV